MAEEKRWRPDFRSILIGVALAATTAVGTAPEPMLRPVDAQPCRPDLVRVPVYTELPDCTVEIPDCVLTCPPHPEVITLCAEPDQYGWTYYDPRTGGDGFFPKLD